MIDASSGGALMNKKPEEAWELIETVADANQHFNRRATNKGVYEVAPSDSTVLAKSLVDIAAMLKEIKEGQQVTLTLLKRQPDDSRQKPVKYCGICSCNSHHTDECSQLQEDNTVASTHNFYDAAKFHPTTGNIILKEDAMVNLLLGSHLSSHKLSLGSLIPTVSPRTAKISDISLHIIDSTIRIVQRENQEMREVQKRTESQLNHLAELLQKIANQSPVNPQAQAQPLVPSPLSSQPLPNPKGGINAVQVEMDNEEDEAEDEEGENDWLYELLKELANSDDEDDEESEDESEEEDEDESTEEDSEDEFLEEGDHAEEEAREEDMDKGKIFFINTLFKEKKNEEEVPIKCEDPGPCLVTCMI
ncbi:hypothetical protein PIB30_074425 [Stylosanthes scabra]|uniref:Uncharacterized protein n=1 Tax=Stylosanthes scabra TaxID=79078 RepID=A0ABU6ZNH6_9FABA|nr:hypothetical protein [Stylosanthes scabra]